MKNSITITIKDLEEIIQTAKAENKRDRSLALCVEIEKGKESRLHAHTDTIRVSQLSGYAECDAKTILYFNF